MNLKNFVCDCVGFRKKTDEHARQRIRPKEERNQKILFHSLLDFQPFVDLDVSFTNSSKYYNPKKAFVENFWWRIETVKGSKEVKSKRNSVKEIINK